MRKFLRRLLAFVPILLLACSSEPEPKTPAQLPSPECIAATLRLAAATAHCAIDADEAACYLSAEYAALAASAAFACIPGEHSTDAGAPDAS